jgi:RND family efflux transporter MFP subunit
MPISNSNKKPENSMISLPILPPKINSPPGIKLSPETHKEASQQPRRGRIAAWRLVPVLAMIAAAAAIIAWRHVQVQRKLDESAKSAAAIIVDVVKVKRDTKTHQLILPGDVEAYTEATLYARTSGYIEAWYTDIGAKVKEGQLLAEIAAPDVDAQFRQAAADLAQAHADLQLDTLNFGRAKDLLRTAVISQQEFDQSRATFEAQTATVKANQSMVQDLQVEENFQKITAPFTGTLTKRYIDIGTLVSVGGSNTGTMLFSLEKTDPLRIYVYVPQSDAPSITVGMKARVLSPEYPDRDFEGAVVRTAGAIDPGSRTLLTEVDIPNPDGTLYAGMYGQVEFQIKYKYPPILLPANAFTFNTAGPQVAVVTGQNRIHWQNVKMGTDYGSTLDVVSGLNENETVVVNPTDDLTENLPVQVRSTTTNK